LAKGGGLKSDYDNLGSRVDILGNCHQLEKQAAFAGLPFLLKQTPQDEYEKALVQSKHSPKPGSHPSAFLYFHSNGEQGLFVGFVFYERFEDLV
jgi:hypothetical protein